MLIGSDALVSPLLNLRSDVRAACYRWQRVTSRKSFFAGLEKDPPSIIFLAEDGIRGLKPAQVLTGAREHDPEIPVVLVAAEDKGRPPVAPRAAQRATMLREGAWDYLRLPDLERFPLIVERALRERQSRIHQVHLEDDFERATARLRESQRLIAIGQMAGSIAHEINNPLESVTNLLYLLEQEQGLPRAAKSYLALARQELDRVVQISKQTLNFFRETPTPVPVRLGELLDQVLALHKRKIALKSLTVVREWDSSEVLSVFPGEMRQVFSNLIGNAIDASTERGKLVLRVRGAHLWSDPHVVGQRVTIADTGSGMTAETRRRIGEAFFTTKGESGTGLGLWVTQSILQRYGGAMLLRSSTGKHHGTVFSVFLPTNLRPWAVSPICNSGKGPVSRPGGVRQPDRGHAKGA